MNYNKAFLFSTLLLFLGVFQISPESKPLATFDGGQIREKDLSMKDRIRLFRAETEAVAIKKQAAKTAVLDRLYLIEAESQNTTVDKYLENYVEKHIKPVTDVEVNRVLQQYRRENEDSPEIVEKIKEYLEGQHEDEALRTLDDSLMKKYKVNLDLEAVPELNYSIPIKGAPFWGYESARVTIVEYSDYECPFCKKMQPAIQQLKKEYPGKVKWVFKSFPLPFHKKAFKAHIASLCAQKQDRFFEYHFKLFNKSPELGEQELLSTASESNLNMKQFNECIKDKNDELGERVKADIEEGASLGVNGTPTIFINNRPVSGYMNYNELKSEIDKAIH